MRQHCVIVLQNTLPERVYRAVQLRLKFRCIPASFTVRPTAVKAVAAVAKISGNVTDASIALLAVAGEKFLFTKRKRHNFSVPKLNLRFVFRAQPLHDFSELADMVAVPTQSERLKMVFIKKFTSARNRSAAITGRVDDVDFLTLSKGKQRQRVMTVLLQRLRDDLVGLIIHLPHKGQHHPMLYVFDP